MTSYWFFTDNSIPNQLIQKSKLLGWKRKLIILNFAFTRVTISLSEGRTYLFLLKKREMRAIDAEIGLVTSLNLSEV